MRPASTSSRAVSTRAATQALSGVLLSAQGGRVTLAVAAAGDRVSVTVRDTGVGIAPEVMPVLFALFTQVDRSLNRSQGGLGIGLALVRRLVEMHEGTVAAHSEGPGKGATFLVTLPTQKAA